MLARFVFKQADTLEEIRFLADSSAGPAEDLENDWLIKTPQLTS
ncbi:unnamed protein product [Tetraodon nigroviridis]|uniref:(spotted green pufferfish) hypothetical protein n=1 Tax=Tetraodon nigroviridis TaxID=99883 RepID=Q4RUN7_TETNG|nr:unnamed protein product [Tetraodon nigroviridis]